MSRTRKRKASGWHYDGSPGVVGANGKRGCRWCRGELQGRRTSFCSDACVHEWKIRTNPGYVRALVFDRDRGVCALCALDTEAAAIEASKAIGCRFKSGWMRSEGIRYLRSKGIMVKPNRNSLWDADHIVPVAEGGGECGLDNYRTLCLKCHDQVTRELVERLARARSEQGAG